MTRARPIPRPASSLPIASASFAAASRRLRESVRASDDTAARQASRFFFELAAELVGARELGDLALQLVAMRDELRGRRPVLSQQLLEAKPALVDLDEALRIRLDRRRVARERGGGVGELAPRALDGAGERCERRIDRRRRIEVRGDAGELIAHGVVALVETIGGPLRRLRELLGMTKARALVLELGLFADAGIELFDLAELEREEVFTLRAIALGFTHALDLFHDRAERRDLLAERVAHRLETAVRVEVLEVRAGIGEAHALVLRGDVAKVGREVRELRCRRGLAVQECARATLRLHDAAHHQLAVGRDARGFELRRDARAWLDLEDRRDLGFARPASHDLRTRAPAEHERERVDDHRFARARLTGEDVEARAELEDLMLEEDDVVDRQRQQHACRCLPRVDEPSDRPASDLNAASPPVLHRFPHTCGQNWSKARTFHLHSLQVTGISREFRDLLTIAAPRH